MRFNLMQKKKQSMRAVLSVSVIILLITAGVGGCSGDNAVKKDEKAVAGSSPAKKDPRNKSDVVMKRLDGSSARVSDYSDKLLFVTFFATWNLDSREMIPIIKVLQSKFSRKVTFLGISVNSKSPAVIRGFVVSNSINFGIMIDGEKTANAFGGAQKLPTTYILLKDGTIVTKIEGLYREKKFEDILRSVLIKSRGL